MKTMKILFTLVVFVMMGLTVSAQAKKDTTVIFKVSIHCPSCKAKLDKNMPFEKGIKDYKLNMKDSTVLIAFRTDKNSVEALRAAIERHDVKVVGICDKDGKLMKCDKTGINVAKKEIKKLAREIVARNMIAAGLADKVAVRKSVMVNVVTIAVPRRVKQTSAARIRKSKEIFLKDTKGAEQPFFVLLIQDKLVHLVELSFHVL